MPAPLSKPSAPVAGAANANAAAGGGDAIDFSDLEEKYRVRMPEGFNNIVVVDNLPVVDDSKRQKLLDVLVGKIMGKEAGLTVKDPEAAIYMPKDQASGKTHGWVY